MSNLATFNAALRAEKTQAMVVTALRGNANEYFRNIASLVANDPKLQTCDSATLICGGLQAAALNLSLSKSLGEAYLIPYSNHGKMEAQFQVGVGGLRRLAIESGSVKVLNSGCVYEGELSDYDKLSGNFKLDGEKVSDKVVGYFAYIELVGGFKKAIYMTVDEVRKHGQRFSKTYGAGPWKTDFDAMAEKTVMKKLLSKYGPKTAKDMRQAIAADQAVIREGNVMDYVDSTIQPEEQEQPEDTGEQKDAQVEKVREKAQAVKDRVKALQNKKEEESCNNDGALERELKEEEEYEYLKGEKEAPETEWPEDFDALENEPMPEENFNLES